MTANLLAHTDMFRAGIARSGAYNRSLTPFGFQNEERTYWQDPDVYFKMSPFSYADKIKTPLLVAQGANDPRVNRREARNPAEFLGFIAHIRGLRGREARRRIWPSRSAPRSSRSRASSVIRSASGAPARATAMTGTPGSTSASGPCWKSAEEYTSART